MNLPGSNGVVTQPIPATHWPFFMVHRITLLLPALQPHLAAVGLRTYEDFVSGHLGELVERSRTTETRRIALPLGTLPLHEKRAGKENAYAVYLKTYYYAGLRRRPWLLGDKASLEANNNLLLREKCGIPSPLVIAHGARRQGIWWQDAFILTLAIPQATPLEQQLAISSVSPSLLRNGDRARRELLAETADLVARMHAAGFFHLDLQGRNLLVSEGNVNRSEIYVLDSARGGMRRSIFRQEHGRLRDLSSLYKTAQRQLSRSEQVRWLHRYLGVRRLSAVHRVLVQGILYDRRVKDNQ